MHVANFRMEGSTSGEIEPSLEMSYDLLLYFLDRGLSDYIHLKIETKGWNEV